MRKMKLVYKLSGQNIFRKPPPNPEYTFSLPMLEQDLEEIMWKYGLSKLEVGGYVIGEDTDGYQED